MPKPRRNTSKTLTIAIRELKAPSHEWSKKVLNAFPLKRGAIHSPRSALAPDRHRYYFATNDPDIYVLVIVSDGASPRLVGVRLAPAIHVELLVTSNQLTSEMLAERFGNPSQSALCRACEGDNGSDTEIFGLWHVHSDLPYPGEPAEHAESILRQLQVFENELARLIRKQMASAHLCIVMQEVLGQKLVWVMDPEILKQLGKIGINLNFQRTPASVAK